MIDQLQMEVNRLRIVTGLMLAGFVYLAVALFDIQVSESAEYRSRQDGQSVRRVRLAATRGRILDRTGEVLADTVPSFCIAAYVEELRRPGKWIHTIRHVDSVLDDVGTVMGLSRQSDTNQIAVHIRRRLPLPLIVWRDVGDDVVARWMEGRSRDFPGIDIYIEPKRVYPHGTLAAHLLGYVQRGHPDQDPEEQFHYYYPEMEGVQGVEKALNDSLEGVSGGRLLRVNAAGFIHGVIGEVQPSPGHDVKLTLDIGIQQTAETALRDYVGACIVMDPGDGGIVAMASSPTFDPNFFAGRRDEAIWNDLLNNPDRPLINRALKRTYPPGSTFKPLIAITALEEDVAEPGRVFVCDGGFRLGDTVFRCWLRERGHGGIGMIKAFEQSCNPYFIQLGLECGYPRIFEEARRVGFGQKTGIPIGGEVSGNLPLPVKPWRLGDTCNLSIGQGDLLVTPIQMAVFVAAIANGGRVVVPRILMNDPIATESSDHTGWAADTLAVVRRGMYDVVQAETGTGKRARLEGVTMAGKTGTAEYGTRQNRKKYAWMTAYAPFDKPRYVVVVVLEDVIAGGVNAAPIVKAVMTRALDIQVAPVAPTAASSDTGRGA